MLTIQQATIPAMSERTVENVRDYEKFALSLPQEPMPVRHFIHGGMYARTITIPRGVMITGALIKLETILIVSGVCKVWLGDRFNFVVGYNVLPAAAHRKQVFVAIEDTDLTMLFPTSEIDVKKAEEQFTDEWRLLTTRTCEV